MSKRVFKVGGKKDPFRALPETFKDAMTSAGPEELHKQLAAITKSELQNQAAKKADPDVKERREALGVATRGYSEATKLNNLKAGYITRQLADKGDAQSAETIRLGLAGA